MTNSKTLVFKCNDFGRDCTFFFTLPGESNESEKVVYVVTFYGNGKRRMSFPKISKTFDYEPEKARLRVYVGSSVKEGDVFRDGVDYPVVWDHGLDDQRLHKTWVVARDPVSGIIHINPT
ncbi:hypothetical protein OG21DRAFT_1522172 [Imleria badia]|nr:hypothetical protein OG21DRAFT_1522172 [Imleria badia]